MLESLRQSPIKLGIIIVLLVILNVVGWYAYLNWDTPLGEPLNIPTATEQPLKTEKPGEIPSTGTPEVDVVPTIEPVCGNDTSLIILVSGIDSTGYLFGLADSIRIVRLDFQTKEVTVLALPRDLWVEIPEVSQYGITHGKLNQAYFYGTEGMGYFDGSGYGSGLLAYTLLENFGLYIDHYLAVNLYSFRYIIDTLGGIDIYLADNVYKKVFGEPEIFLKAGSHHLDGKQAENLARQRISIGDFGRINNQTVILKGVAAKMLSPSGIIALPALADQLKSNVETDLSPGGITQFTCLAGMIDFGKDIEFVTLPPDFMVEEMVFDNGLGTNTAALVGNMEQIRSFLIDFQNGTWPQD
jgi:LCP family protein required for cell wall assembly